MLKLNKQKTENIMKNFLDLTVEGLNFVLPKNIVYGNSIYGLV